MTKQTHLGMHPVWSESSQCAQKVAEDPMFLHADSKDSDQTGRMPILLVLSFCWFCHTAPHFWKRQISSRSWYCHNDPKFSVLRACKGFSVYGIRALLLFCLWQIGQYIFWLGPFFSNKVFKCLYNGKFEEKYFFVYGIHADLFSCLWHMGTPHLQGPSLQVWARSDYSWRTEIRLPLNEDLHTVYTFLICLHLLNNILLYGKTTLFFFLCFLFFIKSLFLR